MPDYIPTATAVGRPIDIDRVFTTRLVCKGGAQPAGRAPVGGLASQPRTFTKKYKGKGKVKGKA